MPKNPSARVVGAPGPPRHRAHHPGAARLAPLAPHVDGAAVGVHRERPVLGRPDYPHQVPEHADHQVGVGVDRDPPADRPPVEAVDRGRQVRPVPLEPELRDVGDHEQAGRGRAEVVRPVRAQWDVGRALRELAPVAAVPRPPAHLRRLAGDQALLAHDPAHDLLGRDDGALGVPGRELAPRDGLAGSPPEVGGHGLRPVGAAARLERRAHALPERGLGVGPRDPGRLVKIGALRDRQGPGHVREPHRRREPPRRLSRPVLLLVRQRARAWCFKDVQHRQGLGEPDLGLAGALGGVVGKPLQAPVPPVDLLGRLAAGPSAPGPLHLARAPFGSTLPRGGGLGARSPRGECGAALAVRAVHALRPVGHLTGGQLARLLQLEPSIQVVLVREKRQAPAGGGGGQAAPVELPENPLALLFRIHRTPSWTQIGSEILSEVPNILFSLFTR